MYTSTSRKPVEGQGFEAFFQEHHRLVYRAAYSVTHSRQDAEDVLQTVFLNVLRRDDHEGFATNVKGYLYRAAINEALGIVRMRARQELSSDSAERVEAAPGSLLEDATHENLRHAIAQLKADEIEMLVLRYEHGYSDEEIGEMLGRTRVIIAVTLYRARAKLKKRMRQTSAATRNGSRARQSMNERLTTEGELR